MVLVVLRHGESEWNKLNKFTGITDVSLSDNGRKEAAEAGEILYNCKFNAIFTSDLVRTMETAAIVAQIQSSTIEPTRVVEFQERDYGDLTGKDKTELAELYGTDQVKIWRRSYLDGPPNGENLEQVKTRVAGAYDALVRQLIETNQNVLIVAHGNSLRALFVHLGIKDQTSIEEFEIGTGIPIQIDTINREYRYENAYLLSAYQMIDSRGFPSLEVQCIDRRTRKCLGKGSTPSGASCGSTEVCEMRDGNKAFYHGKSVIGAVQKIHELNQHFVLSKKTMTDLTKCDKQFIQLDGTEMKTKYGGNTSTALSFCMADTAAKMKDM